MHQRFNFLNLFFRISCISLENPPLSARWGRGSGPVPLLAAGGGRRVPRHGRHVRPHPLPQPLVPPGLRHTVSVCS